MIKENIISAIGTALIIGIFALVRRYVKNRVHLSSPQGEATDSLKKVVTDLVPTVNLLVEITGTQTEALIALLEVTKGKCNGNVDHALRQTRGSREKYEAHIRYAAQIEVTQ